MVAADAQPPSAPSENAATTQAMEQLKAQLQEKDKAVEELNGQILDLEVSSSLACAQTALVVYCLALLLLFSHGIGV